MKKYSLGIVAIIMVGLLAGSAFAWDCYGGGRGQGWGGQNYSAQDLENRNKFLSDTADLRKNLWAKRTELDAIMASEAPDPAAASKVSKEIFEIKEQLRAKADEAGFAGPLAGGYGKGCQGQGRRGGGYCAR